ncbi:hypothetical protein DPMN_010261 [Dreissena polymorpha]|uniref:Uncharacterized protein n=1 Tax=Dreissena polymorpha TaxID=45954 RepID=A0A9D4RYZ2_DREPO|nr:hypothetical protein DPMN_010261 [Dreissena polymorpha]
MGLLPDCCLLSEGCSIPKEEDSKTLKQFRTISRLNIEGHVFLSIQTTQLPVHVDKQVYAHFSAKGKSARDLRVS